MNVRRWLVAVLVGTTVLMVRASVADEYKSAEEALQKGKTSLDRGDFDKALSDFTQAIQLDPKLAKAYRYRAFVWRKKGDYAKAVADYTKASSAQSKRRRGVLSSGQHLHGPA